MTTDSLSSILRAKSVSRDFEVGTEIIQAVRDVDLAVAAGTLSILRGRSGSGKTTLLNLLGAIDAPTSGQLWFRDRELTALSGSQRDELRRTEMGFVFQSGGLMSYMSAYENVEFSLRVAGFPAGERRERAEECLQLVGLKARMQHRPPEMSGGEQQRVAIARAFAHRPRVIFADEPTSALDTAMGLQIMVLFKTLIREEGLTVVMTTHDPSMVEIADQVITLQDGVISDE